MVGKTGRPVDTWPTMVEFLEDVFGPGQVGSVWTTGFRDIEAGASWHGRAGLDHLSRRYSAPVDLDLYFCVGRVRPDADRRALGNVVGQPLLIVDDIGTKIDRAKWDALFLMGMPDPTFRIETSPGNETWGWVLSGADDTPERAVELALVRAWLPAKGLTDDVMDATRYIRLPGGWNSKPKYRDAAGIPPRVKLVEWRRGARADLDDIGRVLLGRDDWRDADMPVGGMTSAQLAGLGDGALTRSADMNDPEPLIQLAREIGLNPRPSSRAGVVDALCPNAAEHGDRAETGFAFLGGGLCQCMHAACQGLRSPDFRAMMEAAYDEQQEAKRAQGRLPAGEPRFASEFMWRAQVEFMGLDVGPSGQAALLAEAEAMAQRGAEAKEVREARFAAGVEGLAQRFVWVVPMESFFDTVDRCVMSRAVFEGVDEVRALFEYGASGKKRASAVLLNRGDLKSVKGVTYRPGDVSAVVVAPNENGREVEQVNLWTASTVGRRSGVPRDWLDVFEHVFPDADAQAYFLDFMAFLIQKPGQRTVGVPIVVGGQGTGKSMVFDALIPILGVQNVARVDAAALAGGFNEFLTRQLVILDEVKLDPGGQTYNRLKGWTGVNTGFVRINPKYGREFSIEPCCNFVATTNNLDALKGLEADDRRFAVYVSPAEAREPSFYARVGAALRTRAEQERLHEFLATRDISAFNPQAPAPCFANGSRGMMLVENLTEAGLWVWEACQPGGRYEGRKFLTVGEVEAAARAEAPRDVKVSDKGVIAGLQAAGCEFAARGRSGRGRLRVWFGPAMGAWDRSFARENMEAGQIAKAAEAEAEAAAKAEQEALLGGPQG